MSEGMGLSSYESIVTLHPVRKPNCPRPLGLLHTFSRFHLYDFVWMQDAFPQAFEDTAHRYGRIGYMVDV